MTLKPANCRRINKTRLTAGSSSTTRMVPFTEGPSVGITTQYEEKQLYRSAQTIRERQKAIDSGF
jgi:hypothetical protein